MTFFYKRIFSSSPWFFIFISYSLLNVIPAEFFYLRSYAQPSEARGTKGAEQQQTLLLPCQNEHDVFVFMFILSANKDLSNLLTYNARGIERGKRKNINKFKAPPKNNKRRRREFFCKQQRVHKTVFCVFLAQTSTTRHQSPADRIKK